MVLHDTPPNLPTAFLAADRELQPAADRRLAPLETMFNHTFQRTLPPCGSIAILPIVEIESLNTSVRVCYHVLILWVVLVVDRISSRIALRTYLL